MAENFEVEVNFPGFRLDRYVAERCGFSRSYVQKLISEGLVLVEGKRAKSSRKLKAGEKLLLTLPPLSLAPLKPEAIPLKIVYEDKDILVVDKPAGLTVHPAPGHESGTLVGAILAYLPELAELGGGVRPGIVHRLDKDSSGLVVVAKNEAARIFLSKQLKNRELKKSYLALVRGYLSPAQGVIEGSIGRHPRDRQRMAITSKGKEARTFYQVKEHLKGYTLLEIQTKTGRTHQIRVHLSAIGYPVVGDRVYGVKSSFLKRQFLHAHLLGFKLPRNGEFVDFESALPVDLKQALEHVDRKDLPRKEAHS